MHDRKTCQHSNNRGRSGVFLIVLLMLAPALAVAKDQPKAEWIVAKVNGEIITSGDIEKEIGPSLEALARNEILSKEEKIRQQVVLWNRTVRDKAEQIIALQAAKRVNIQVSDAEAKEEYESFVKRLGGEQKLQLYADERGVTLNEIQDSVKRQLTIQRLLSEKIGLADNQSKRRPSEDVFVRPAEIHHYYKTHMSDYRLDEGIRIRQIFLPWKDNRKKVEALGASIVGQLRKGADFAQLAGLYSTGPLGKYGGKFPMEEAGTQMKWQFVLRGQLLDPVERVAFSLAAGGVSDPIVVKKGLFIVKLEERREKRVVPYREAQKSIQLTLWRMKVNAKVDQVRQELRQKATLWPHNLFEGSDLRFLGRR